MADTDPLDRIATHLYGPQPELHHPRATNLDRALLTGLRRASAAATILVFGSIDQRAAVQRHLDHRQERAR